MDGGKIAGSDYNCSVVCIYDDEKGLRGQRTEAGGWVPRCAGLNLPCSTDQGMLVNRLDVPWTRVCLRQSVRENEPVYVCSTRRV